MYIYENTGKGVFVVGFYDPKGKFITETVHAGMDEASERVHYLNGGIDPDVFSNIVEDLYANVMNLNQMVEDLNTRLDRVSVPFLGV